MLSLIEKCHKWDGVTSLWVGATVSSRSMAREDAIQQVIEHFLMVDAGPAFEHSIRTIQSSEKLSAENVALLWDVSSNPVVPPATQQAALLTIGTVLRGSHDKQWANHYADELLGRLADPFQSSLHRLEVISALGNMGYSRPPSELVTLAETCFPYASL